MISSGFDTISFEPSPREDNVVAHEIARNISTNSIFYTWVDEPLSFLMPFLLNDESMFFFHVR